MNLSLQEIIHVPTIAKEKKVRHLRQIGEVAI